MSAWFVLFYVYDTINIKSEWKINECCPNNMLWNLYCVFLCICCFVINVGNSCTGVPSTRTTASLRTGISGAEVMYVSYSLPYVLQWNFKFMLLNYYLVKQWLDHGIWSTFVTYTHYAVVQLSRLARKEENEEIWLIHMTKVPYTHRKIQKATWQHKKHQAHARLVLFVCLDLFVGAE